jgi:ACS family tartrate transporter-like MFS transporter
MQSPSKPSMDQQPGVMTTSPNAVMSVGANQPGAARDSIEARTIRKVRIRILPYVFLLFVIAFVDRINISFAEFTMQKALVITPQQFGLVFGIFFFGYCLFEIPSNLLLHKIGARVWIARILITWGVFAALTGVVRNVQQLYALRFLLGLAEAGYFPGMVLYLTYWFRPRERAQAVAMLLAALPVASIVGAPLSGLILDHVHWFEYDSWRWLLILEGMPAIIFGFLTYLVLPNRPADAKFLGQQEKQWLQAELSREETEKLEHHPYSIFQALATGRVWNLAVIHFGAMMGLYTLSSWIPQLIRSNSANSNFVVGLLVMFPQLAGLGAMILWSRSSDRSMELGGLALFLMTATRSPWFLLPLVSILAAGVYCYNAPFWALPMEFLTGFSAAAGIALINSIGNLAGFVGPYLIGFISERAGTLGGFAAAGVPMIVSAVLLICLPKRGPSGRGYETAHSKSARVTGQTV